MFRARNTNDDSVAVLALERAVVREPAEGDLCKRKSVLLSCCLDQAKALEVRLVPVVLTVDLQMISKRCVCVTKE